MVVVGRLDQKMPGPIICPSPALLIRHTLLVLWPKSIEALRLNNNGEANIVCLRAFVFTRWNCRSTIILLWKIMLGETFHSRCVCHITSADIPYHSNHSVSTEKNKNTQPSQVLTAGRFQLALVDTWPDCCYLQLHIQPVFILIF